jgi:Tol biopolymer transport system component
MVCRLGKDGWTAPEEAAFTKGPEGSWAHEPHITPDGRKLYFGSERPRPGKTKAEYGLWVVERTEGGGWSEPAYFGSGMYVSVARNGDLYMTDVDNLTGSGKAGVVRRWTGTGYAPPQRLGGAVNSPEIADHSFIAPDESYILFDSTRPGGQSGGGDLYVCFRKPDGSWSEAMNLGDTVNAPGSWAMCPSVSPDGRYIFYTAYSDIYWVSAGLLEPLRAEALR